MGPTTRMRLGVHFFVRLLEVALLYGHFAGSVIFGGIALMTVAPTLNFHHPSFFAIPALLVASLLVVLFAGILVFEFRVSGLPRAPEPGRFMVLLRRVLRLTVMAGVVVAVLTSVFYLVLGIMTNVNVVSTATSHSKVVSILTKLVVSVLVLVQLVAAHFDWLRRLARPEMSAFATFPPLVLHSAPSNAFNFTPDQLATTIRRGARTRIVLMWVGGLACVLVGVDYAGEFFPELTSGSGLLARYLVGFFFFLWISISASWYLLTASRRETGILDGSYTATGRHKWLTVYFSVVFFAGLVLALACFASNMYVTIVTLKLVGLAYAVLGALFISWAPLIFYAALCMDIFLLHIRNVHEDQSVCCRVPIPLTLGSSYEVVVADDNSLNYDTNW